MQGEVLSILRCPEDHSALAFADQDLIERVNLAIRAGHLMSRSSKQLQRPIDGGLLRADGAVLYPIFDDIPVLLRDDAIALDQLED
jgi:uncharacterized protein YbaR (Trm112 family)